MLLIAASFAVLIRQSLQAARAGGAARRRVRWRATLANLGYFYGPVSALAYAFGYVARKQGLAGMPDPGVRHHVRRRSSAHWCSC